MRISIEKRPPRSPVHVIWGVMALIMIIGAGALANFLPLMPPCMFHVATGIPCLSCGGTHCAIALSRMDLTAAFLYNPAIMICMVALVFFSLSYGMAVLFKRRLVFEHTPEFMRGLRAGAILMIVANWAYLIIAKG